MNVRPLGEKILVKRVEVEGASGWYCITRYGKRKTKRRQGYCHWRWKDIEEWRTAKVQVKKGDRVLFSFLRRYRSED